MGELLIHLKAFLVFWPAGLVMAKRIIEPAFGSENRATLALRALIRPEIFLNRFHVVCLSKPQLQ